MPRHKTASGLTAKEERFVAEYLIDKNGTQAAIRAGYSERSAKKMAWELLRKPHVKAYVTKALEEQQQRTLITADQVLIDIKEIGDEARLAGDFGQALKSRELLGKHHRLFSDKVELTGKDGEPFGSLSDADLEARIKRLMGDAG